MNAKERDRLDILADELRGWKADAELRFEKGNAKMDRILSMLEDDPYSSNKGLLTRANDCEVAITALKQYVDERQRKRKWWIGIAASVLGGTLLYLFRWVVKIENYHV